MENARSIAVSKVRRFSASDRSLITGLSVEGKQRANIDRENRKLLPYPGNAA